MPKGEYLQYGGQAVVEGVMMRSPRYFSIACRAPNGEIVLITEAIEKTWIGRQKWLKLPFLRGSLALLDSMALGARAMRFASDVQVNQIYQPVVEGANQKPAEAEVPQHVQDIAIRTTMVVSVIFALFIFVYLPNAIAEVGRHAANITNSTITNLISEIVKMVFFIAYVAAIGRVPAIHELFRYHGAEHKAINTLEADRPLEMEECLLQTRLHPRCGTSFAMIVLLLGLAIFTFVPRYPFGQHAFGLIDVTIRFAMELCILPFVAGISYELLRLAGKFRRATIVNILFAPGLASQYLTTREPAEPHVEVALAALKAVLKAEESGSETG